MAKSKAVIGVINMDQICKQLDRLETAPEKALEATVKDFRTRAPGWVAREVMNRYNIKRAEIVPAKAGSAAGGQRRVGGISVNGHTVDTAKIVYKGRVLTPVHFGMTPKVPREGAYTLKVQVIRGEKKTLGKIKRLTKKQKKNIGRNRGKRGTRNSPKSPWMLSTTGNRGEGGTNFIPFQRRTQPGDLKFVNRTISLPQMVSHEEVGKGINKAIETELGKRFEHHITRFMPVERK